MRFLGAAAVVGIAPGSLLRADPLELELLIDVVRDAHEQAERRDRRLAQLVVGELASALKRGQQRH